ncbi:hypothetical protein Taro_001598 [Colocasia esculenta]|uniref:Aminotransferase-like plant mobile domain-containing protein n=1 Tax=Colocasia esculenta TaxID=4460 RepID=A0A843TF30_COLES|nr:hypothetical protein [Colocasia esculenta]
MSITNPSHTFHSASSSGHHVREEHVIEDDEEDEIDSQDGIDDNENMDEGDDEPLFDIASSWTVDIGLHIEVLHCNLHLVAVIPEDASVEVVKRHARALLLHLLDCTIFSDKTGNSVPLMYLPLLEDFDQVGRYSWGGATLAYLYRQLSIACKSDAKAICGSLTLLQLWSWERLYIWDVLILQCILWHRTYLWVTDRVLRQFGRVQPILGPVDALDRVT